MEGARSSALERPTPSIPITYDTDKVDSLADDPERTATKRQRRAIKTQLRGKLGHGRAALIDADAQTVFVPGACPLHGSRWEAEKRAY